MKKYFSLLILFFVISTAYAQYGNIELSTGGFSFIPAFMDRSPNINFVAGTGTNKLVSAHLVGSVRMKNFNPRGMIFITRLKAIDKKFKMQVGVHLPAVQIDENDKMDSFFAQEVRTSFPVSEKVLLSSLYIHGKGQNNDLEINLFVLNASYSKNKFGFTSQVYYLDYDHLYGAAQTISYKIQEKISLTGFANYTIPSNDLFGTLGLSFDL